MKWVTGIRHLPAMLLACAIAVPAVGSGDDAGDGRGRSQGRQGRLVHRRSTSRSPRWSPRRFAPSIRISTIEVERSGSERVFQRINQEYQVEHQERRRRQLVGRVALHFLEAAEVARAAHAARREALSRRNSRTRRATTRYGARRLSRDGLQHQPRRRRKDAPTGYADLLDPQWKGKLVKSHPGYSGTSLTGTYAITKVAGLGLPREAVEARRAAAAVDDRDAEEHRERRARGDGRRQRIQHVHRDRRQEPGEDHLPEGRHAVRDFADRDLRRRAASERCARAAELSSTPRRSSSWLVNEGGTRSVHPDVKEPAGRTPLAQIKMLPDDPVAMLPQIAEIKKRYTALFGN